jgi:hypothetical protein
MEMPGLRLTLAQVQRLCGVEPTLCQQVLDMLVDAKFLCVTPNGAYARISEGTDSQRPHTAKAGLSTDTPAHKAS